MDCYVNNQRLLDWLSANASVGSTDNYDGTWDWAIIFTGANPDNIDDVEDLVREVIRKSILETAR